MPSCFALISAGVIVSDDIGAERKHEGRTKCKVLREEPAHRKVAHHEPEVGQADLAPHAAELALGVEPPDGRDQLAHLGAHELGDRVARLREAVIALSARVRYDGKGETHPVAKTTTSASSSLPSVNLRPLGVNFSIWVPLLSLILPSTIIWHAPTSARTRPPQLRPR